jgi:hypothetical protein
VPSRLRLTPDRSQPALRVALTRDEAAEVGMHASKGMPERRTTLIYLADGVWQPSQSNKSTA